MTRLWCALFFLMVSCLMVLPGGAKAGKIKRASEEVRGTSSDQGESKPQSTSYDPGYGCYDYHGGHYGYSYCPCGYCGYHHHCPGPNQCGYPSPVSEEKRRRYFAAYPYQLNYRGYLHVLRPISSNKQEAKDAALPSTGSPAFPEPPKGSKSFSLRLTAEYGYDFDRVHRPSLELFLTTTKILGFSLKYVYLAEKLNGGVDQAGVGEANLIIQFIQTPQVLMHAGLGVRMFFDRAQVDAGLNFTTGLDVFPIKPLVLSASVSLGHLVDASVAAIRGQLGFMLHRAELFVGYDALAIERVVFHGPLVGVRLWL